MGVHLIDLTNFVHLFIDLICTAKVPSSVKNILLK